MTSWDLGGGGGNSFPFDTIGDHVAGTVLDLVEKQQTDMQTQQPASWDNGDPKMMSIVTLQTELRDPTNPADDGKRTVALSGSKKPESMSRIAAVIAAVKAATGGSGLQYGGTLTIQYVGDGQPSQRGFNAPKQYQAWYQAPSMQLDQPVEHKTPPPAAAPVVPPVGVNAGPPPAWATPPAAGAPPAPAVPQPAGPPPVAPPPVAVTPPAATNGQANGAPAAPVPTAEAIAGLRAAGLDPAQIYGPGWEQRVAVS